MVWSKIRYSLTWLNIDLAISDVSCFPEFRLTPVSKVTLARRPMYLTKYVCNESAYWLYVQYSTLCRTMFTEIIH